MATGIYAAAASSPSSKLKTMKGPIAGVAGTAGAGGIAGNMPGAPAPTGGHDVYAGNTAYNTGGMGVDAGGSLTVVGKGLTPKSSVPQPTPAQPVDDGGYTYSPRVTPPAAAPPSTPGIDINEIPGWLDKFKPDAVPREQPIGLMPREVGKGPEDRRAAESAAFARAGERIARIGKGNMTGLRNQMTRRGISGSGIEAEGIKDVQNNTAGQLGEVVRDQAIEGLRREQAIDDRDLAAGISQRGQDLGIQGTNYTGGIAQRGQDINQNDWKMQALPSILALLRMKSGAA
jgi:hypothetical protein